MLWSRTVFLKIQVTCEGAALKRRRESIAESVIAHFGERLPDRRLLCFFDDEDWPLFKTSGEENRGMYWPIKRDAGWANLPPAVKQLILVPDPLTFELEQKF